MSKNIGYRNTNAEERNNECFWYNYNKLKAKAISMFEWVGLPEEIDERYLEKTLFEQGYVCFFKDQLVDGLDTYFALQCTLGGRFNVYNIPTEYRIFTASGYNATRNRENSVIIFNNYMHTPSVPIVMLHARRITEVERTIETNLNQLKKPYIYLVNESQKLTLKNLFRDVRNNEELIIGNKDIDVEEFQAIGNIAPNNTLDLYKLKRNYYSDALNDLGIDSISIDKKERLVSDEAGANDEDVMITRLNMLNARKQACEQINKMFNLNVDVKFRNEGVMATLDDSLIEEIKQIGVDEYKQMEGNNGEIHNDN